MPPPKENGGSETGTGRKKGAVTRARQEVLDAPAVGPFPARIESLASEPQFEAKSTLADPDAARVVYSAQIDFPSDGEWRVAAVIKEGEETSAKLLTSAEVGEFTDIPRPASRPR